MLLKMVAHSLAFAALLGLLLFLPAGTLAWPQAWVFMALFIGCSEAIGVWLKKSDPDLLAARMKSPISADQKFRVVSGKFCKSRCGGWSWYAGDIAITGSFGEDAHHDQEAG